MNTKDWIITEVPYDNEATPSSTCRSCGTRKEAEEDLMIASKDHGRPLVLWRFVNKSTFCIETGLEGCFDE